MARVRRQRWVPPEAAGEPHWVAVRQAFDTLNRLEEHFFLVRRGLTDDDVADMHELVSQARRQLADAFYKWPFTDDA